jgi:acetyltransferase-like isoleucine patch superfamily enzyme
VLGNSFYIKNKGQIFLGESVSLHSFPDGSSFRTSLNTYFPEALLEIGNYCNLNGTAIHCNEKISIGNKCMFGPGTVISDNDSHRVSSDPVERRKKAVSKPVIIMDNVWVGMNSIILKGVTIGENSIIAAGSVVVKDVTANTLVGGNPARVLKQLE